MEEEKKLDDQVGLMFMIQAVLQSKPELIKMYPQLMGLVDMIESKSQEFLGNNEKMIVLTRVNGVTRAIILNTTIDFTFTNKMKLEAQGNQSPVLNNYELSEYKQKLLSSMPVQMLKERYEKMHPESQMTVTSDQLTEMDPSQLLSILNQNNNTQNSTLDKLP